MCNAMESIIISILYNTQIIRRGMDKFWQSFRSMKFPRVSRSHSRWETVHGVAQG